MCQQEDSMHEIVIWKFALVSYNKKDILELKPNGTHYTNAAKACLWLRRHK